MALGRRFREPEALWKGKTWRGLGRQPREWGLAFLLLFGLLLGLHGGVILGHVENVDVLAVADGLQQAEQSGRNSPSKERLQAIEHHPAVAVTQLKPERVQMLPRPQGHLFFTPGWLCPLALSLLLQMVLQTYLAPVQTPLPCPSACYIQGAATK